MRYLLIITVLLSGCAAQMIGVDRQTGERISLRCQDCLAYVELTTALDGENFKGKVTPVTLGQWDYQSVMLGDKSRTMRCGLSGVDPLDGGAGCCTTSDGRVFDVTW